jgi:hypothetical protein
MEQFTLEFQDRTFFERYAELSGKQIRFYLDLRRAVQLGSDPDVRREVREKVEAREGSIGREDVDFVMNLELLCEQGFILRERTQQERADGSTLSCNRTVA